jgi:uncharacterized protein YbcC (UPF0753/DUF2309 family)
VREEGIRRHLEAQSETYETLGTAGFFSLPMIYRSLEDGRETLSCPIVIRPRHTVPEIPRSDQVAQEVLREGRAKWMEALHGLYHRLETNFATAYSLIDLLGVPFGIAVAGRTLLPHKWRALLDAVYHRLLPAVRTSLLVETRHKDANDHSAGGGDLGFSPEEQADVVEGQLRMIGLTQDFARLVVFCGHGATTGALDDSLLFYLRARGLSEKEAQALLIQAFVGEAIESIVNDDLRELAIAAAQRWLEARA